MSTRAIHPGGLMRCCLLTIVEYDGEEVPGETRIACRYHGDGAKAELAIGEDGAWKWEPEGG